MLGRINWRPTAREIRYFAITLLIASLLLASVLMLIGKTVPALRAGVVGVALSMVCYLITPAGRMVYLLWMSVTYVMGRILSPIVIAIIFYLVITPIGFISKLSGKDPLKLKKPKGQSTYFLEHPDTVDRDSFRRQF